MATSHDPPRVIAAGASAGGVEALTALVRHLPADLAAPLVAVMHISPAGTSALAHILARAGSLPAVAAEDGQPLRSGTIYVAPPDSHVLVEPGVIRLSKGPREKGHRPAVDPTLRTLADAYGASAIGVVLSGTRDDGTAGLARVKAVGGVALVQDPRECLYDGMPSSAITHVDVDAILPVKDLAARLDTLTRSVPAEAHTMSPAALDPPDDAGRGTRFTCPDCGGVLFEHEEADVTRYRCSIGHVFLTESLDNEQERALERALWGAVRSLEDRAVLLDRLARGSRDRGQEHVADRFAQRAGEHSDRATVIRGAIRHEPSVGEAAHRGDAA